MGRWRLGLVPVMREVGDEAQGVTGGHCCRPATPALPPLTSSWRPPPSSLQPSNYTPTAVLLSKRMTAAEPQPLHRTALILSTCSSDTLDTGPHSDRRAPA